MERDDGTRGDRMKLRLVWPWMFSINVVDRRGAGARIVVESPWPWRTARYYRELRFKDAMLDLADGKDYP